MSKPFDATTKFLIGLNPRAWLQIAGFASNALPKDIKILDTDLSTITAAVDQVLDTGDALDHLELQASYDALQDERIHWYNGLLRYEYRKPVRSVVFLLRPSADGPKITGGVSFDEAPYRLDFRYHIVRLWEIEPDALFAAGLSVLPLAPLCHVATSELPGLLRRMENEIAANATPERANSLWTATYVLMGLSFKQAAIDRLLRGVRQMKESVTYQAILAEGREQGIEQGREQGHKESSRQTLLRLGEKRFGSPTAAPQKRIAQADARTLDNWLDRLLSVESWDELLAK